MLRDGDYFLVVEDQLRIARDVPIDSTDGSITVDLYRNLEDYAAGRVMEYAFKYWSSKCPQPYRRDCWPSDRLH